MFVEYLRPRGYPTLFIDEAGKKREVWTDGFGRTIEGDEPDSSGNLASNTCYSYDSLGNLLQIVHGTQTRTYGYDVLSRFTSATIPELGGCSVTYGYDNNSNPQTSTAPAPNQTSCTTTVTATYYHDAVNRLTKITYGATTPVATPTVQYGFDGSALSGCTTTPPTLTDSNPKGRMTAMCDGSGATSWAHDAAGRIIAEKRTIQGTSAVTQTISYSYNLDGSVATVTYPSGKTVTYTVSNAQRLTAANDTANGVQFATAASYAAPGMLQGLITGQISGGFSGISETHNYNNSLEYTSTKATSTAGTAMDLSVNYASSGDNGSITSITNNADNGRTQNFTYDPLNRIASATTQATSGTDCWGQNFAPDSLANLNTISSAQCSSNTLSVSVDGNNHINISGFSYDASGNMLQDGSGTGYSYSFDAENRLVKAAGMSGGPYCYVYDGNGLRVAKKSGANSDCTGGTVTKLYWRSFSGDALSETDGSGSTTNAAYNEYVFFAGRRVASRNGTGPIFYYFADQLGSTRTITTGSGSGQTPGQLCYDADFTPYGQEISHSERLQTTACPPNYKFTAYERDPETGLDYAFARYYSSRLGRFLSTDPLGGSIGNLQSHNAYGYVVNNPVNFMDPTGFVCSGNIGNSGDTPCNPANDGGGGGSGAFGGVFDLLNFGIPIGTDYFFTCWHCGVDYAQEFMSMSLDELMSEVAGGDAPVTLDGTMPIYGFLLSSMPGAANAAKPWELRSDVVKLLRAKNGCSDWFNQGTGSAADIMSHVPIEVYTPKDPFPGMPDGGTGANPATPINVNSLGRFYTDRWNWDKVGDVYSAGSYGARMVILIHELAHKVVPPGFISDDSAHEGDSEKNTQKVMEHCATAINAQTPKP